MEANPPRFDLSREPGGWLSLTLRGYPYIGYHWLRWRLSRDLALQKCGRAVEGFHDHAQCYQGGGALVVIGWHTRRGFVMTALNRRAESLLRETGRILGQPRAGWPDILRPGGGAVIGALAATSGSP